MTSKNSIAVWDFTLPGLWRQGDLNNWLRENAKNGHINLKKEQVGIFTTKDVFLSKTKQLTLLNFVQSNKCTGVKRLTKTKIMTSTHAKMKQDSRDHGLIKTHYMYPDK